MTIHDVAKCTDRAFSILFLLWERVLPGRQLPHARGWYLRALFINLAQLGIILATAKLRIEIFGFSLFDLSAWQMPMAEDFVGWLVGTFFFYWWHRIRHPNGFWLVLHQIHHSPSRIEVATSLYKHPLEIFVDAVLSALILYPLLGCYASPRHVSLKHPGRWDARQQSRSLTPSHRHKLIFPATLIHKLFRLATSGMTRERRPLHVERKINIASCLPAVFATSLFIFANTVLFDDISMSLCTLLPYFFCLNFS